jgi:large subunit ribosomal protein L15
MQLNTLKPASGSVKDQQRVGRGQGSGKGGTSTRGHKGAQSRSGYKSKRGFEGGQLPLQRRLPRYGFKKPNRVTCKPINLEVLQRLVEKEKLALIDTSKLVKYGIVNKHTMSMILSALPLCKRALRVSHQACPHVESIILSAGISESMILSARAKSIILSAPPAESMILSQRRQRASVP